ncbi:MAG: glycosyltransferase family 8 protein [Synergistaceae bacterium]|nr:glycosyltransferase family 8 protein [Candidatus Equadaptatus faecalis]
MDKIHVALAVCDPKGTYTQHAAVTIASMFANTKSQICVHFLHDETLTEYNRSKLTELAGNFQQVIEFVNVDSYLDESGIDISKLSTDGFKGTVFRLLLPELSSEDKMIYLDCDIVVTMDIAELWDINLHTKAVGVVRDVHSLEYLEGKKEWPKRRGKIWSMLGIEPGEYFNAGVLLIDLRKLREEYDFLKEVETFYAKYGKCITFADQDCLNFIFAKDRIILEEKFNSMRYTAEETELSGRIWHMSGAKPWITYSRPKLDELYWKYLRKTPYCTNEDELITNMLKTLSGSQFVHLHSGECFKRLKKQMKENIFNSHLGADIHAFFIKTFKNR